MNDTHDLCGQVIAHLAEENRRLREVLVEVRVEIDRWSYGNTRFGTTPREQSVLDMLATIDRTLDLVRGQVSVDRHASGS